MKSKVTIIIPIYNVEKYIERCVRSVLEQTLLDIEFIFVNDATQDNSVEILNRLIEEYPQRKKHIKIIHHKKNLGLSAARKTGIENSSGEYIGWVDSDDWIEKDMFRKMYAKAQTEDADIVCCNIYRDKKEGIFEEKYQYDEEDIDVVVEHPEWGIYSAMWNKLIRKDLYVKNDIYPLETISMWEDFAVTFRLRCVSKKTVILNECLYHYNNKNENSITGTKARCNLDDKLNCAEFLCKWLNGKLSDKNWIKMMQFFFQTKASLFYPPHYNLKVWRTALVESNKYIWKYTQVPLLKKIEYWAMIKLPFAIADKILKKHYGLK